MSPSVLGSNCSRFWLNKGSNHETMHGGSQATSAANDSLCGLVEPWGTRNNDTHQVWWGQWAMCNVMQQLVSVIKLQPALPFVGSNTQGNTLFVVRKCLLSARTAGSVGGGGLIPLLQAIKTPHHCSPLLRFKWIPPSQRDILVHGQIMLLVQTM